MRCIIDTNVFINFVLDGYVSDDVRAILDNYENMIYGSPAKPCGKKKNNYLSTSLKTQYYVQRFITLCIPSGDS